MAKKVSKSSKSVKSTHAKKIKKSTRVTSSKNKHVVKSQKVDRLKIKAIKLPKLTYKRAVKTMVIVAVILLGFAGWGWWKFVFTNPDRLMSDMLDGSLQVSSVTKVVAQNTPQSSGLQAVRLGFAPGHYTHILTQIHQPTGTVATETVGTKTTDFFRYKAINTSDSITNLDEIINVWGEQKADKAKGVEATALNQAVLTIVPFGNLNHQDRAAITDKFKRKDVYHIDSSSLEWSGLRPRVVYDVSINPKDVIEVLREYATVTGVGDVSQLNPSDYENARKLVAQFTIDPWSRQLISINYGEAGRIETYTGYGVRDHISYRLPQPTVSMDKIQVRTQEKP